MRLAWCLSTAIFFLAAEFSTTRAEDEPTVVGLNSLPEVEFSALSQRDPNPLGERALVLHPEQWKHGETEHFIIHYTRSYVATAVAEEAEFHYRVVAKELEREPPPTDIKSHIYIFERPGDWQQFQTAGQLEKWTGGIHSAGSLFILRDASYRYAGNTLGHEIVHLVLHRYYPEGLPLWLDEGLAQVISKNARANYQRARNYISRVHSESIAPADLIPLKQLLASTSIPNDHVETFYNESERLVRFFTATDKAAFLSLLDSLGHRQPFETSFSRTYGSRFATFAAFEDQFREYATKDSAGG